MRRLIKLKDVCLKIGSGATPRGGSSAYQQIGIPLIRSQNVRNDAFDFDGLAYLNEMQARELDGVTVLTDDVLLNITGDSVARVTMAPRSVTPARVNQHVAIIRPNPEQLNPHYLYYYLLSPYMQDFMLGLSSGGGTRQALTKGMIESFEIPCPTLSKQKEIASILASLDAKRESNRALTRTLEEMSQALFKSWFVDFDPVVAKSEGRKPFGMSDDIAALFPDSFEESELGAVPKGWSMVETGHLTDIQNGFAFKSDWWRPQGTPVVKIGSVKPGYVDVADASYLDSKKAAEFRAYELEEGDILIGLTGYPGEVGLVPRSMPKPLLNQRVGKFVPKRAIYSSFVYTMTRRSEFREQVEQRAHGTAQLNVSTGGILSIKCVIPSEELLEIFHGLVSPMISKILNCLSETSQLSKARDALLPELLGGRITETTHVREATAA